MDIEAILQQSLEKNDIAEAEPPDPAPQGETEGETVKDENESDSSESEVEAKAETEYNAEILEIAKALGYNPDYTGENRVDPKTFILRQKEFTDSKRSENKLLKKQLDRMEKAITELRSHQAKDVVAEAETEIARLESEWENAVEEGDVSRARELNKEIEAAKAKKPVAPTAPPEESVAPEFDQWRLDNPWYDDDPVLRDVSLRMGQRVVHEYQKKNKTQENPPMAELLAGVSRLMRPVLTDETENEPAPEPPPAKTNGAVKPKPTAADVVVSRQGGAAPVTLSREEREVISALEDANLITVKQYEQYKSKKRT